MTAVVDYGRDPGVGTVDATGIYSASITVSGGAIREVLIVITEFNTTATPTTFLSGPSYNSVNASLVGTFTQLNAAGDANTLHVYRVQEANLPSAGTYTADATFNAGPTTNARMDVWSLDSLTANTVFSYQTAQSLSSSPINITHSGSIGDFGIACAMNSNTGGSGWLSSPAFSPVVNRENNSAGNFQFHISDGLSAPSPAPFSTSFPDGLVGGIAIYKEPGLTISPSHITSHTVVRAPTMSGGISTPTVVPTVGSDEINFIVDDPLFRQRSKDLLLDQFKLSTNINLLLDLQIAAEEDFQNLIVEWAERRLLSTASGSWLDEIGAQLGVVRLSNNDDTYKASILAATKSSVSAGTRDDIVSILQDITSDSEVDLYIGGKTVEINIFSGCYDNVQSVESIRRFFPVLTFLRVLLRESTPFGFEGDDESFGLSSVFETVRSGGAMSSRAYSTEDDL